MGTRRKQPMAMYFDLAANPTPKCWMGHKRSIVMKMEIGVAQPQNAKVKHPK